MKKYVELLKEHLNGDRSWEKQTFKVAGTLYRGVTKGRFTFEQGVEALNRL